jgi:hypothetical protein
MSGLELLENNPKTAKLICSYYLEIMINSLNNESLPEEFKEQIREQVLDNEKVGTIIDGNPRNLFDFFDEHKIYINISTFSDGGFNYSILGNTASTGSKNIFKTRKEAEKEAVGESIKHLELSLTNLVIDKENS